MSDRNGLCAGEAFCDLAETGEESMLMLGADVYSDENPFFPGPVKGSDFVFQLEAQSRVCFAERRTSYWSLLGSGATDETVME